MRPAGRLPRAFEIWILCALLIVLTSPAARAQAPEGNEGNTPTPGFLTAYRGSLGAVRFTSEEEQFAWEGHFAGDVDLFDYGAGRVGFSAAYEVVLGNELRSFDPNQGLYELSLRVTRRLAAVEGGILFHHVSRHLSDRPKVEPIDWNLLGLELSSRAARGGFQAEGLVRGGRIVKRSFVDYEWQAGGRVRVEQALGGAASAIGQASVDWFGVDPEVAARGIQVAAYGEGGIRLSGRRGAVDLFVAYERRVDAHPLIRDTSHWAMVGFRLIGQ
jgi:hypothetical protein